MEFTNNDIRRLRRLANKLDCKIVKHGDGFMLIDLHHNFVILGATPIPFSASIDEVTEYLEGVK